MPDWGTMLRCTAKHIDMPGQASVLPERCRTVSGTRRDHLVTVRKKPSLNASEVHSGSCAGAQSVSRRDILLQEHYFILFQKHFRLPLVGDQDNLVSLELVLPVQ